MLRLFPVEGRFPFGFGDLLWLLLFVAVGIVVARSVPMLRGVFVAYGLAAILVWVFPSGVGGNFERLADYWATALLLLAYAVRPQQIAARRAGRARRGRDRPGGADRADDRRRPAGARRQGQLLERRRSSSCPRTPTPTTASRSSSTWGHWESYYLAQADIPLTRGWFRQDDFPINRPLYDGALDPANYQAWISLAGGPVRRAAARRARLLVPARRPRSSRRARVAARPAVRLPRSERRHPRGGRPDRPAADARPVDRVSTATVYDEPSVMPRSTPRRWRCGCRARASTTSACATRRSGAPATRPASAPPRGRHRHDAPDRLARRARHAPVRPDARPVDVAGARRRGDAVRLVAAERRLRAPLTPPRGPRAASHP